MDSASKKEAVESGADIAAGMAEGMDSGKTTLAASAEDMAETIADYDHFSVPKKGPLSDFDESMPDMIDMMAAGMEKGKEEIAKKLLEMHMPIEKVKKVTNLSREKLIAIQSTVIL